MTLGFDFKAACTTMLHELGAVNTGGWYPLQIETVAGALDLAPQDGWLACRFVDVERAKSLLGCTWGGRLNPVSGKWNWHPEHLDAAAVDAIRDGIAAILASTTDSDTAPESEVDEFLLLYEESREDALNDLQFLEELEREHALKKAGLTPPATPSPKAED
jgi:hypothetical protein